MRFVGRRRVWERTRDVLGRVGGSGEACHECCGVWSKGQSWANDDEFGGSAGLFSSEQSSLCGELASGEGVKGFKGVCLLDSATLGLVDRCA